MMWSNMVRKKTLGVSLVLAIVLIVLIQAHYASIAQSSQNSLSASGLVIGGDVMEEGATLPGAFLEFAILFAVTYLFLSSVAKRFES
jgi:hypothetical protein